MCTSPSSSVINDESPLFDYGRYVTHWGSQVEVSLLDVGWRQQARQLLQFANSVAPLAGIFHLAMVLKDKLMSNQVFAKVL